MTVKITEDGVVEEVRLHSINDRYMAINIAIDDKVQGKTKRWKVSNKVATNVVIMNLLACVERKERLHYSRDKITNRKSRYNKRKLSSNSIIKAVDELEALGYVTNNIAKQQFNKRDKMSSYMTPTDAFMEQFCTTTELAIKADRAALLAHIPIVLKDVNGNVIDYKSTPEIAIMERILDNLNYMNSTHHFVDDDGVEFVNLYTRIFNNSSFELGGRFFRAAILNMEHKKSKNRLRILIDRQQVVECDYSSLHLRILAEQLGCIDTLEDDAYMTPLALADCTEANRDLMKLAVNIMLNSTGRGKATAAIQSHINKCVKGSYCFSSGKDVIDAVYQAFPQFADSFCQPGSTGMSLMHYESMMTSFVAHHMTTYNLPVLPVHDSNICRLEDADTLIELMSQAYKHVLKTDKVARMKLNMIVNNVHVKRDVSC